MPLHFDSSLKCSISFCNYYVNINGYKYHSLEIMETFLFLRYLKTWFPLNCTDLVYVITTRLFSKADKPAR